LVNVKAILHYLQFRLVILNHPCNYFVNHDFNFIILIDYSIIPYG